MKKKERKVLAYLKLKFGIAIQDRQNGALQIFLQEEEDTTRLPAGNIKIPS